MCSSEGDSALIEGGLSIGKLLMTSDTCVNRKGGVKQLTLRARLILQCVIPYAGTLLKMFNAVDCELSLAL